jgi:Tol biopolymer transport system component
MGNPNLAGNDVFAVSLSSDARTLCIGGSIQGGSRPIGVTTRPNRGDSFAFASLLSAPVNSSPAVEGTPFLSRDELSLFFVSQRFGGQGDRDLYAATRASTGGSFDTLVTLGNLNSAQRDHAPWLSSDALTIYFASRRASVSDDLWRSTRSSQGVDFPSPVPVSELNSNGDDTGITFSDDGLVVYFASDRASGLGGMDLYRAARARLTDPFSAPELVPSLNTAADDAAPQLTLDGQELFFVSDRNGGDSQLFRASLASCP